MKTKQKKQTRGRLPILIRYRAQDFETRYLDDPRILYIEEYHDLHRDDGFVAMIPSEKAIKRDLGSNRMACCWVALILAVLSLVSYRLFFIF